VNCKFCKQPIDEAKSPPSGERKVLQWHWQCFQYLAINGMLHAMSPDGKDSTDMILDVEFRRDEQSKKGS